MAKARPLAFGPDEPQVGEDAPAQGTFDEFHIEGVAVGHDQHAGPLGQGVQLRLRRIDADEFEGTLFLWQGHGNELRLFATIDEQYARFMKDVPLFEQMLVKDGVRLFKFYFSVSRKEQERRFKQREKDLLRQYKLSPVDLEAQKFWSQYSLRKFQMLSETNRTIAPWWIVDSDDKKAARLNSIRVVLNAVEYKGKTKDKELLRINPEIIQSGIEHLKVLESTLMDPKQRR